MIALAASLTITAMAFDTIRDDARDAANTKFVFRVSEILESIDQRMAAYTQTL